MTLLAVEVKEKREY